MRPDPELLDRLERLKVARNTAAVRLDLAPGVLCPNGTLESIVRARPSSIEDLAGISDLRRWQRKALGEELLRALGDPPLPSQEN